MKSFIVSLEEFFKLNRNNNLAENFNLNIKTLLIPKYQREYKWQDDKIAGLISDISSRDKFLGNIILDEKMPYYEIVDGQQRITTIYLILMSLYNIYGETNSSNEQANILSKMKNSNFFTLKNETIGEYILQSGKTLSLNIDAVYDIYFQTSDFLRAYRLTYENLKALSDIRDFVNKLLDCKFMVLINDEHTHTTSIEQIFLDINFKSQLLDIEDIFKGYCFQNYRSQFYDDLKSDWVKLKKCSKEFEKIGYENLSQYLYHYLLSVPSSYNIPISLSYGGRHFLEGKTMDITQSMLHDMIKYGENILKLINDLTNINYNLEDICNEASVHDIDGGNVVIKQMLEKMLKYPHSQYYKFPLFMLLHKIMERVEMKNQLNYENLKKIITNLFVYSLIFILSGGKKSKASIDHSVINILYGDSNQKIAEISTAAKILRREAVEKFEIPCIFNDENFYCIYSIMDKYKPENNFISNFYSYHNLYNKEHLIVPDKKKFKIQWQINGEKRFDVNVKIEHKTLKKKTINFIIIPIQLNENIDRFDIVEKIKLIKDYYGNELPKHIKVVLEHIESMAAYVSLTNTKNEHATQEEVTDVYENFINNYFSEDNEKALLEKLKVDFKNAFRQQ